MAVGMQGRRRAVRRIRVRTASRIGRVRAGFTILELLIVLTLVALTATVSISAFFSRTEVTLDSAARLLAEDLRSAQNRAATMHRRVVFQFTADGRGYVSFDQAHGRRTRANDSEGIVRLYPRDAVFEGVRISDVALGDLDHVLFQDDGAVVNGGQVTITYQNETRTVVIEPGKSWIRVADH